MKTLVRFLVGGWLFINIASAARTNISLLASDWTENGTNTSARALSQTPEGYLRATCNTYRGYINYRTKATFNLQGATVRYKWRVNCASQYCWNQDGCYPWGRMSTYALSTNHSYNSSIVISTNTWIFTEIYFNTNRTWSADYSYSGYGLGGINHNSGTIVDANWNLLATSFLNKYVGDGYAYSFYFEIAEAYFETPGPVVQITSPADGSVFDPNEMITFNVTATGGTSPYQFSWASSKDGTLGTGDSILVSTLSQGIHTITVTCVDNIGDTVQKSITVHVVVPPLIEPIADHTITNAGSYNGPVPVLSQGETLTTWSLVQGPAGMTINTATGQVSWPIPLTDGSPFAVTIRAQNPKGSDEENWQLEVTEAPRFSTTLWTDIKDGRRGIDGHDAYARTAIDLEGNVLAAGYIDSTSGNQDAAYLVKYSPDGTTVLWSKTIDAPSASGKAEYNDRFNDVATDSENNVIVVGTKSGNWTGYSLGSYHTAWWIQKYTPDGQTLLWEKLWQDTANSAWQTANGVYVDAQDNVYVAGNAFTAWGGAEHQWVIFKYDKNGNILLGPIRTNFINAYYLPDVAYDIVADTNGDIYAAGVKGVTGSDGSITNNMDWQVCKYNGQTGAILWQDTYSGSTSRADYARGLALDGRGHLVVAGYTNKGTDNSTNANYDWLVIRYNAATGARIWTQTYESTTGASEACYDIVADSNGDVYVCGSQLDAAKVAHRRIAKLSNINGATLAQTIWPSTYTQYYNGMDMSGNLLAAAGVAHNGTDNDAFISLLTIEYALQITQPAYNAWFQAGAPVTFVTELVGAAEPPYYYSWTSDIDGLLGTGHTLATSGLSLGEHLITCQLDYGTGQMMQTTVRVHIAEIPQITEIEDQTISDVSSYTGPTPAVNPGAGTVTWSLIEGPAGMTINSQTGIVSWTSPVGSVTPYTITIQAQNPLGSDQESWQITVLSSPQIETIPAQTATELTPFISTSPVLLKGTEPVQWQLVSGPAGMTLDPATGAVSWENPLPSFGAYSVTIRATNTVGSDNETFTVIVQSIPQIAEIADVTIIGGQAYNLTPSLIKGMPAVEWSLLEKPENMSINPTTGAISWPNPGPADIIYPVTIQASNVLGSDTESYTIRVILPPVLDALSNETIHEATVYSKTASVLQGSSPLTFTLLGAPAGMSINSSTGVISWGYANGNYSPYTVTVRASNQGGTSQQSFVLTVLQRPLMKLIANALAAEGAPYAAPIPALYQGSAPITWSLISGPAGMAVDENTGIAAWPTAVYTGSPHSATIKALNVVGADTKTWSITVVQAPVIAEYSDRTTGNSVGYIGVIPVLTQGSHVTWSLDAAPAGMTINASTGQIIWSSPIASDTPYTIRMKATNIAGADTEEFQLTVLAKPVLANIGNISIEENRLYTSNPATLLAGQPPVTFSLPQAPAGMTIDSNSGAMNWPRPTAVGSPHTVRLRAANAYGSDEKTFYITVPVGYAADVWTDIDTVPAGTPIPIQGHAYYLSDGTAIANVNVQLQIKVRNTSRVYTAQTNAQGEFEFTFQPLPQEAGLYSIHAGHPLQVPATAQDTFTLVAMRASETKLRPSLIEGQWYETTVTLKNLGNTDLTNISAAKVSGPNSIEIDFASIPVLPADSSQPVTLRMRAIDASVKQSAVSVLFGNDQHAQSTLTYTVQVIPLSPQLTVFPKSLNLGMVRGQTTNVSFEVYNMGGKATPELIVLIPDADWLSMNNPENIGIHEPNDVTVVTLTLNPDAALPLGPYTGSIVIYGTDMSQTIPFTFNCISSQVGGLDLEAVDEFTYYADGAPKVDNASVTLRDAFNGNIIYFNKPMPEGRLLLENLAENYYNLEIQAPEHGRYSSTVYVAPGENSPITAFLPRQLVKYTWTVVPTQYQDKYTVTLNTTYETHVPAPVVVIEPANVDLSKMVNGRMQVNFTITNHGLVAAEEFHLMFNNHLRYQVQLLTDFRGRVGPNETIVIPALITDLQSQPAPGDRIMAADENLSGDCDPVTGGGYYILVCGKDRKWHKEPLTIANWLCNGYNAITQLISGLGFDGDYDPDGDTDDNNDGVPPGAPPKPKGSGKTPTGGGGTTPAKGNGGKGGEVEGGKKPGTSRDRPIVTDPNIRIIDNRSGGGCDPCPQAMMEAMLECAWSIMPMECAGSVVKGAFDCVRNCWREDFGSGKCKLACYGATIDIVTSCIEGLTPIGIGYNIVMCVISLYFACDSNDAVAYHAAAADFEKLTGMDLPDEMPTSSESLAFLIEQARRLEDTLDALNYILGDPIWFSGVEGQEQILGNWLKAFNTAMNETGDGGEWISPAELDTLRTMPLPSQIITGHVDSVCQRWNRSLDYWQAGKFTTTDLQPGDNPDFIASDISYTKFEKANNAVVANEELGYFDLFEGIKDGFDQLKVELQEQTKGVCAKVHLQIEQSAVITRTAFRATLDMQNQSQVDSLDGVRVQLEITDALGNDAASLFGLYPPLVTGLSDVNGGGNLDPGRQFHAEWLMVPTLDAAPLAEKQYFVGGSIQYTVNGHAVTFPIFPDTITVKPDANLHLKYFYEKDVFGDDPFTEDVIEPSEPFVLGLMVTNTGAGSAYNMTLNSAQPKIIRHEKDKDILIDFALLDVSVGNQPRIPSLEVNLGNILPNTSKVALWRMQCSLQGEFTGYQATFAHTDTLGEPRLSLIQSASTHSLIRTVRADRPQDDAIVDFLVNDIPDTDAMPDTLHRSEGDVEPVEAMSGDNAWLTGTPGSGTVTLTLPQKYDGFFYVRLPNPGWPHFELKQVVRSDGKTLPQENAWTTYRMQYPEEGDPYAEIYLHLFDNSGTEIYTLYYQAVQDLPPAVTDFEVADAMDLSEAPLPLTVTFSDNTGVDPNSPDDMDIQVSGPGGQALTVQFVQILSQNGGKMTVQYQILPPGGLWEGSDNGLYSVTLVENQVADLAGHSAQACTLGGFLVSIPECVNTHVISCDLVSQKRISRTQFEMTYTVTLKNNCNKPIRNLRVIPKTLPAKLQLISHDISFCYIAPNAQAVSQDTFVVRMDYADPPDTLTQFQWRLIPYGPADVTMDGLVDIADLAEFAAAWLGTESCFDWTPEPNGDGNVDLKDFTIMAEHWLQ
jgi:hypothetical protein